MYIWKTRSLADDIKNNNIRANDWKNYYLAISIFSLFGIYLIKLSPQENVSAILVEFIIMIGIFVTGITHTYKTNKGDEGIDYIPRITALTLPILVKIVLLVILVLSLTDLLAQPLSFYQKTLEWRTSIVNILVQSTLFWRINISLKYINS